MPGLAERIRGVLDRDPRLELARTSAQPSLGVFAKMLADDGVRDGPIAGSADDAPNLESIRPALLAKLAGRSRSSPACASGRGGRGGRGGTAPRTSSSGSPRTATSRGR